MSDDIAMVKSGNDTLIHVDCPHCGFDWNFRLKNQLIMSLKDVEWIYARARDGCSIRQSIEHLERIKKEVLNHE